MFVSLGATFLLNLLQLKILTACLPKDAVGSYFAASGVSLFVGTMYLFGFPMVFARFIPRYEQSHRKDRIPGLLGLSLSSFVAFALPTLAVLFAIRSRYSDGAVTSVLPIAFAAHMGLLMMSIVSSYYVGLRRMHVAAILNVIPIAGHVAGLYLIREHLSVVNAFNVLAVSSTLPLVIALVLARPRFAGVRQIVGEIRGYWRYAVLVTALSPFILYVDRVIIAGTLPLDVLGLYMVSRRLENGVNKVLTVPLFAMAPEFSARSEPRDNEHNQGMFRRFLRVYWLLAGVLCVVVAWLGPRLIPLVSTRDYLSAYPILVLLLLATVIGAVSAPYTLLARSLGRMDLYFFSDVVWLATYAIANASLISRFGVRGVALSAVLASIATLLFVLTYVRPRIQRSGRLMQ
ncbi:MAG TPA: lipopolysaccharide biosynthesis protein [Candidatus Krumholzibacteria bacterium]|nr:lipopolysaccharide biosynthesis protein [Candidatus Krumholzibacteria bacterium]